jgi:hypothetical protein
METKGLMEKEKPIFGAQRGGTKTVAQKATETLGATKPGIAQLPQSIEKHVQWLLHGPIRSADGMVAAWSDRGRPSHVYEESTGYLLTLLGYLYHLTGQDRFEHEAIRVADALVKRLGSQKGFGRSGIAYLFDTAVCLRGLATFLAMFKTSVELPVYKSAVGALNEIAATCGLLIAKQLACDPKPKTEQQVRWSERFNVHHIKVLHHCWPWVAGHIDVGQLIENFVDRQFKDGLFLTDPQNGESYLHAHCYGVEGLLALEKQHHLRLDIRKNQIAQALSDLQLPNGGIPKFDPVASHPTVASDTTAQAVRIWQCIDPETYSANIQQALSFLEAMADEGGGILYSSNSNHLNSWTTIFAVQAMAWQLYGAQPEWIV